MDHWTSCFVLESLSFHLFYSELSEANFLMLIDRCSFSKRNFSYLFTLKKLYLKPSLVKTHQFSQLESRSYFGLNKLILTKRTTMLTVSKKPKTVQPTCVKCARTLPIMRSALNDQIRFVWMRRRMESKRLPASVNLLTRKYFTEDVFL